MRIYCFLVKLSVSLLLSNFGYEIGEGDKVERGRGMGGGRKGEFGVYWLRDGICAIILSLLWSGEESGVFLFSSVCSFHLRSLPLDSNSLNFR